MTGNHGTGAFFAPPLPRVFAHRGLALGVPENTLAAFAKAVEAGVQFIETDVRASSDGIAMICHDDELARIAGVPGRVGGFTATQLGALDLGQGHGVPTLAEALTAFPLQRFNIDLKSEDVVLPAVAAIRAAGAADRVLVTSFSEHRRRRALILLPGVASSASAPVFLVILIAAKLGVLHLIPRMTRGLGAIQVPELVGRLRVCTPRVIAAAHRAGLEVHVWTVNEPADMLRLRALGVDGIVTDRADLAHGLPAFRPASLT
jgi:glycerophosphoryl diester phosphodiesterase